MPKIDDKIFEALKQAINSCGSQNALAKASGVRRQDISRFLDGTLKSISISSWNKLIPFLSVYLPEYYRFNFTPMPEETLAELEKTIPDIREVEKERLLTLSKLDLSEEKRKNPNFLMSDEQRKNADYIIANLNTLDSFGLNFFASALRLKVDIRTLVSFNALEKAIRKSNSLSPEEKIKFLNFLNDEFIQDNML